MKGLVLENKNKYEKIISDKQKQLDKYYTKKEEVDGKIKKLENEIEELKLKDKAEKYENIEIVLNSSNLSVQDVLNAIDNGDLKSIENIIKNSKEGSL